jgi:hypothetical protein
MQENANNLYIRMRNEAIQMFRDLPDAQRNTLYRSVIINPSTPIELTNGDEYPFGRAFSIFMNREKTSHNWIELNSIIASLVVNGMNAVRASKLYYIIHNELRAMNREPAPGAANMEPPPVNWIEPRHSIETRYAAGIIPGFFAPPPTAANSPRPIAPAPVAAPAPPPIIPSIALPANSENVITYDPIQSGNVMVNFHGERNLGRYYKRSTYNGFGIDRQAGVKLNPFTRAPIRPANITVYRAEGGKRRKITKKRKIVKSRKSRTYYKKTMKNKK